MWSSNTKLFLSPESLNVLTKAAEQYHLKGKTKDVSKIYSFPLYQTLFSNKSARISVDVAEMHEKAKRYSLAAAAYEEAYNNYKEIDENSM